MKKYNIWKATLFIAISISIILVNSIGAIGAAYFWDYERFIPVSFDKVVERGDQYVFLSKTESGFASNQTEYGVYNLLDQTWSIPFTEMPDGKNLKYAGCGIFVYSKDSEENVLVLVNAKTGELYEISEYEMQWLENGHDSEVDYYYDYALMTQKPEGGDYDIYLFDGYGNAINTGLYETYGLKRAMVLDRTDTKIAIMLSDSDSENAYRIIAVIDYEGNVITTIEDKDCLNALYRGSEGKLELTDDYIVFMYMEGMDKKNYLAVFNNEGDLVISPEQHEKAIVTERGNLLIDRGNGFEEILLDNLDAPASVEMNKVAVTHRSRGVEERDMYVSNTGHFYFQCIEYPQELIYNDGNNDLPFNLAETYYLNGAYSEFRGTVVIPPDYPDLIKMVFWVVGDNKQVLYQSDVITNATKPFDFSVNVEGCKYIQLGISGVSDNIAISDAFFLSKNGSTGLEEMDEQIDENNPIEREGSESKRLSLFHAYIGGLSSWGPWEDNMGNTYKDCFVGGTYEQKGTYDIGGIYSRMTATVAVTKASVNETMFPNPRASVRIIGDGRILYENTELGVETKPFEIEVDLTGVVDLTIEIKGAATNLMYYNGLDLILADAVLWQ